ncbi:MAG: hypothetical protein MUO21_10000 [Nitrososphaeraceae archaeon]|nr:hypothetical protein [Nitrososphaeraceae archaeon]
MNPENTSQDNLNPMLDMLTKLTPQTNEGNNSMLEMLNKLKPLTNDFMKMVQKQISEPKTDPNGPPPLEEENSGESVASGDSGGENGSDGDENSSSDESNKSDSDPALKETVNSVFGMLESMFKNMDKYKNREHLAFMPKIFEALSNVISSDGTTSEYTEAVKENSTKICEMLKEKDIEVLCDDSEFKLCVLNTTVNFQKLSVEVLKKKISELEAEVSQFNETTDTDTLLKCLYDKFNKKK